MRSLVGALPCGTRSSRRDDPTSSMSRPRPVSSRQTGQTPCRASAGLSAPHFPQPLLAVFICGVGHQPARVPRLISKIHLVILFILSKGSFATALLRRVPGKRSRCINDKIMALAAFHFGGAAAIPEEFVARLIPRSGGFLDRSVPD